MNVSAQAGFATVQAGFATVSGLAMGRCPGRLCHGVSTGPGRLQFATVLAAWVGAQAGFATVSGLGRCPGLRLVLVLAVAVGRRKHNFTQLNRIKIHNFIYDQCGAP